MVVFWLLSCLTFCLGQDSKIIPVTSKPDLSGTWVDVTQTIAGSPKTDSFYKDLTLTVLQRGPELRITRKFTSNKKERSQELVYYTDGRGESNPEIQGKQVVKSITKWDGDVLISKGVHRIVLAGDILTFQTTDMWQISRDGTKLVKVTSSTVPRSIFGRSSILYSILGDIPPAKKVFRRVS